MLPPAAADPSVSPCWLFSFGSCLWSLSSESFFLLVSFHFLATAEMSRMRRTHYHVLPSCAAASCQMSHPWRSCSAANAASDTASRRMCLPTGVNRSNGSASIAATCEQQRESGENTREVRCGLRVAAFIARRMCRERDVVKHEIFWFVRRVGQRLIKGEELSPLHLLVLRSEMPAQL